MGAFLTDAQTRRERARTIVEHAPGTAAYVADLDRYWPYSTTRWRPNSSA